MNDPRISEIQALLPKAMLWDWVRLGSRLVRLLKDHHHAERHGQVMERILSETQRSVALREDRARRSPLPSYPPTLPITARKDEIVEAIRSNQVLILAGETGSGKTTQLPKMCLEAGLGIEARIGCTQPRRVAALSISRRIAEELNLSWGRHVGCKIRFDDRSSPETYIKVMTDGILLAETQGDPLLSEYNAIIVDEAHERSLNIDFLLGYLKGLLVKRPDLKLIITSATIETEAFSKAFNDAPIIEVSGRMYPVEVQYAPLDAATEEEGEITYIDAAARAAERALCEPGSGDILIFMPGERDIRETCDLIWNRCGEAAEIVPLFGRLSSGDQQRVFAATERRKVVVATNIAETSLTIPNIRFVIDAGLARISRYNPRTRIKRLPVEPISQSSADQRKGRSGRVREGLCIRLYAEEDFNERPRYTQPEIQRANLAEVILRMKAFRLGDIENFPFINPPTPAAIQAGYALLQELGALDADRQMTALGHELARLPIDPTLGRMLLQARQERATRELLIIASGLSIQDPRERPMEQKEAANSAHKRFADPKSDFLTLLNIWNAVHEQWEALPSQNQRRKFCKANFLSYLRMREWQDLHAQLHGALEDLRSFELNESNAAYDAIHRSILTGLLAHVAQREERNLYKGAGNRKMIVFPGSALYGREERIQKGRRGSPNPPRTPGATQPEWIVAGEIVETSQLFARTVAGIDPEWIVALAPHLCKKAYLNPHWSPEAGRVLADEVVSLHGLEVRRRKVAYGNVDSEAATRIFVRSALAEDRLFVEQQTKGHDEADWTSARNSLQQETDNDRREQSYKFLLHNRALRQKIETWQTRVRHHGLLDLDEALVNFYQNRIHNVSSIHELNKFLRGNPGQDFLCASEQDLVGELELSYDAGAFPDQVALSGQSVPVKYAYKPGEEQDGVTFQVGFSLAEVLSPAALEWAVPGLRESQVAELLKALPKSIRKQLMPLHPKVPEIAREFQPLGKSLTEDLGRFLHRKYGVEVPATAWPENSLPEHLRPRIEIVGDADNRPVASGRNLQVLRKQLERPKEPPTEDPAWAEARKKWERFDLRTWSIPDLPERMQIAPGAEGFPGLSLEDGRVNLRLFRTLQAAKSSSLPGLRRLVELELLKDLAWAEKDLRSLSRFSGVISGFMTMEMLQETAIGNIRDYILPKEIPGALNRASFDAAVAESRKRLPGVAVQLMDLTGVILQLRQEILKKAGPAPKAAPKPKTITSLQDLNFGKTQPSQVPTPSAGVSPINASLQALLPPDFLRRVTFEQLQHMPRYLKALSIRAERAAYNPAKDMERALLVTPYVEALEGLRAAPPATASGLQLAREYRWLVEELKVSVFAQELGTAVPISPKRLDQHLEKIKCAE